MRNKYRCALRPIRPMTGQLFLTDRSRFAEQVPHTLPHSLIRLVKRFLDKLFL